MKEREEVVQPQIGGITSHETKNLARRAQRSSPASFGTKSALRVRQKGGYVVVGEPASDCTALQENERFSSSLKLREPTFSLAAFAPALGWSLNASRWSGNSKAWYVYPPLPH